MKLWALVVLLFLCADFSMPSWGAFQFDSGQSIDAARRLPVQAAVAKLPPAPLRFPTKDAPRIVAERPQREASAPSTPFDPHAIRIQQDAASEATSVDPA